MKNTLLIIFFLVSVQLNAQLDFNQVLADINQHLLATSKGSYHAAYKKVSMLETDTSRGHGHVTFFKPTELSDQDSIAKFVFIIMDTIFNAYDGRNYIRVGKNKIKTEDMRKDKGIADYMENGNAWRARLLSIPILTNPPFTPIAAKDWPNAQATMSEYEGKPAYRIFSAKSYYNSMRLSPKDGDSTLFTMELIVDAQTYNLRRFRSWAERNNGYPQFIEVCYSPIQALPEKAVFEDYCSIEHLQKKGYVLDSTAAVARQVPEERIAVGDSIPNFMIAMSNGDSVGLFDHSSKRYILLEFWYRGCGPCNMAMPGLDKLYRKFQSRDVSIFALNCIDKEHQKTETFYRGFNYTFPIAFGARNVLKSLKISAHPVTVVIDSQTRKVVFVQHAYSEKGEVAIENYLDKVVQQ